MTPAQRSRAMSKVRGKDTGIERFVRSALHRRGFRFRKNVSFLPGRPDIVLPKYQTVIFVHGCFWHGHQNCKAAKLPETRREFWENKIFGNVTRDAKHIRALQETGWKVLIIWECALKYKNDSEKEAAIERLIENIKPNSNNPPDATGFGIS
jgi:DNA mismatch endonuclease (patch repair protein)